jgi:hypothetical protein
MNDTPPLVRRIVARGPIVPGLAALVLIGAALISPSRAAFGYLVAFAFGLTILLGALAFQMMSLVTSASWTPPLRRELSSLTGVLPIYAVLFVPIALFAPILYPWARRPSSWSPAVAEAVHVKRGWLAFGPFLARSVLYLVIFCGLALLISPADAATPRRRAIAAGGLPVLGLALTFAAFDWMMSLDPAWQSNAYGVYVFAGAFLAALSLLAVLGRGARGAGVPERSHALGNLMLSMTIFWAYIAFTQFLIMWIANLPVEVTFYLARSRGAFGKLAWVLALGHFVLPFLALLQRPLKRAPRSLAVIGAWILVVHYVDLAWLVLPAAGPGLRWIDLLAFPSALVLVGGTTVVAAAGRFTKLPGQTPREARAAAAMEMP